MVNESNPEYSPSCDVPLSDSDHREREEIRQAIQGKLQDLRSQVTSSLLEMGNYRDNNLLDEALKKGSKSKVIQVLQTLLEEAEDHLQSPHLEDDWASRQETQDQIKKIKILVHIFTSNNKICVATSQEYEEQNIKRKKEQEKRIQSKALTRGEDPEQYIDHALNTANVPNNNNQREKLSKKVQTGVVHIETLTGQSGTGFFIGPNQIATNTHVISYHYGKLVEDTSGNQAYAKENLFITNANGDRFTVIKIEKKEGTDLAVLTTREHTSKYFSLASAAPQDGERLLHIGFGDDATGIPRNPYLGIAEQKRNTSGDSPPWIAFDGSSNFGDSGGPILNAQGEVVSILSGGPADDSDSLRDLLGRVWQWPSHKGLGIPLDTLRRSLQTATTPVVQRVAEVPVVTTPKAAATPPVATVAEPAATPGKETRVQKLQDKLKDWSDSFFTVKVIDLKTIQFQQRNTSKTATFTFDEDITDLTMDSENNNILTWNSRSSGGTFTLGNPNSISHVFSNTPTYLQYPTIYTYTFDTYDQNIAYEITEKK